MGVYNLKDTNYFGHDLKNIFDRIDSLYSVSFSQTKTLYHPKRLLAAGIFWASKESNEVFNDIIPEVKSLHKDMYALIESIVKAKTKTFDVKSLAGKYRYFDEFRLLNNLFKHFEPGNVEIDIVQIVIMDGKNQLLEVMLVNLKILKRRLVKGMRPS